MSRASGPTSSVSRAVVLVAEDDRNARVHLSKILTSHGLTVEAVEDGQAAVERVQRGGIDLVILDVVMPRLNGIEACRIIKRLADQPFLPVLLLTSKADVESRLLGLRIGADDYLGKPVDEREMLARVDNLLRSKRAHDDVMAAKRRLEQLVVQDELTGLYNQRHANDRLREEWKRAERYRYPLACALVSVDGFAKIHETFGQVTGDNVLRDVAHRIARAVREVDLVARCGGEEFLLILPNTHFSGALTVVDRVWRAVGEVTAGTGEQAQRVTSSLGVALFPCRDVTSQELLLKSVRDALERAKSEGHDRICVLQQQGYLYRPAPPTGA